MTSPIKCLTSRKLINLKKDITDKGSRLIGEQGGFGDVYKAKFHKRRHNTEEIIDCAVKYIRTTSDFQSEFESFYGEISAQNLIKHPALLPLLGFYIPFCESGKLTLVTPYMEKGSLWKLLYNEKRGQAPIEWNDEKRMITIIGIAAGLCAMHKENLVHRDIKPANILFDDEFRPKICDFGLSKVFEEGLNEMLQRTNCGTESYKAPEMLIGDGKYNGKVDIFAYGLVLYEIFAQETFSETCKKNNRTYIDAMASGYRPDLSKNTLITPFFRELIEECWQQDPNMRPSIDEVLNSLLKIYEDEEFIGRDGDVDDYIIDTLENLGFDVEFCK